MPHTMASSAALARGRAAVQICGQDFLIKEYRPGVPCRRSRYRQAISSTADAAALVNRISSRRFWAEQEPCAAVIWQLIDPEFPVRLEQERFFSTLCQNTGQSLVAGARCAVRSDRITGSANSAGAGSGGGLFSALVAAGAST